MTTRWRNRGGGGHSPVAGSSDFTLCAQQKHKPHLSLQNRGVRREYWQSLSYLRSPAPHGLDRTRLRQMNKMARHKQCQKLRGSRSADFTAPQGVTPQTLLIYNTTKLLQREGGWVTKFI